MKKLRGCTSLFLLLCTLCDLLRELRVEALNASCRIDELLLAGKERMAVGADFETKRVARRR